MINDLDMQGWAYLLAPTFQFVNTAGKPLTEGYLEVYIAGTRNKYYCASDFNGTLHPFQIPLDSLGSNIVLADPSQAYDVYVYNRFGSLVMSRYNVSPSNAGGSGVLTITISSNDDTVQVVKDGNNYDLSIADTIARIDDIEDRLDEIGDGSVGYAIAHSELASDGLFELTNDKNKDIDYTGDMHGFRLKPGHVYQLNFNAKFDCNNDTNKLISGKFYLDGDNVVAQEWQFNVDNSFEHQESFNGSTVLVIPEDVSYYDVKLKYSFDDEALDLYLNKISIVDVTSIVSQGASGGGVEYTDGNGIIVDNSNHTINVDMDYINSHLDIDASSILSSAYNYTDVKVSQVSGDIVNIISEVTGSLPIPEQVQSDWNQDDDTQVDYIKNKPDLDIYATHDELETTVTNVVSSVSSVLHNEIENIDLSSYATHDEVDTAITNASGDIINYVDNSIDNVTNVIESVSGDLQEQINNIPAQVQSDWNESDVDSPAYIANKPDLSIYATNTELGEVSGNIVSMIPDPQIQSDWTQTDNTKVDYIKNKPEEEEVDFEEINLSDYALASAIPSIEGIATVAQVSSVSSVLQNEIDNIPEQVNADWESNSGKSEILNKPDLSIYATHDEVSGVVNVASGNIINYVDEVVEGISPVQSDWTETDSQDLSYIKNKPTERQLIPGNNISITASGSDYVISSTGGGEQVQSDWTEDDTADPSYILNKPNELELVAGNNIEIAVSGTNIVISSTASAVTGLDLLYGQFTSNNVSTTATMAKSKGNINVSDGKIQFEQGKSYHVTVRGYYQQTNAANSYSPISYVEYITSNQINIDIDRSRTDAQYFELSYDLFNLNSDVDYQVAFSGGAGLVKDLVVEVHSLGGAGTGSSSGGTAIEYDAGYGINISNQVISVDSSIIPDTSTLATKAEVSNVSGTIVGMIPNTSNLATKAELNSASANIIGQIPDVSNYATTTDLTDACNNVISMIPEVPESANLIAGDNITITASGNDYVISSTGGSGGGGETYTAGNGIDITNNVISVDNTVALKTDIPDVSNLATKSEVQTVSAAIPDTSDMATQTWVDNQGYLTSIPSNYATDDEVNTAISNATSSLATKVEVNNASATLNTKIDEVSGIIPTLPDEEEVEFEELDLSNYALASAIPDVSNLIPGDNITITASGDDYVISSTGGGAGTTYTAGDGIEITNNEISVDNTVALKTDIPEVSGASGISVNDNVISLDNPVGLVAGDNITIEVSGSSAIISSLGGGSSYTAGEYISIDNNTISVTGLEDSNIFWVTNSSIQKDVYEAYQAGKQLIYIGSDKKQYLLGNVSGNYFYFYALYTDIFVYPSKVRRFTITASSSSTSTVSIITESYSLQANWNETNTYTPAYINNKPDLSSYATKVEVQAVSAEIPTLPQEEEIDFEEVELSDYALASAIPDVSNLATKNELSTGLASKQNTLTGITDVQVVQSLPASPVATVLYLIPEV